jgi:hypothetical protein
MRSTVIRLDAMTWHGAEQAGAPRTGASEFYLFSDGERVIDLDAEIPDGALQLGVPKQQLHGTQVRKRCSGGTYWRPG